MFPKDKLEKDLAKPETQKSFTEQVIALDCNMAGGKLRKRGVHARPEEEAESPRSAPAKRGAKSIQGLKDGFQEAREFLGILWPIKVYKLVKGKTPTAKQLTTKNVKGKPIRGVLMERSEGQPVGSIELWNTDRVGAKMLKIVHADQEGQRAGLAEDIWGHVAKRQTLTIGKKKDEDDGFKVDPTYKRLPKLVNEDSEDDEDGDLFDDVWGFVDMHTASKGKPQKCEFDEDDCEPDDASSCKAKNPKKRARPSKSGSSSIAADHTDVESLFGSERTDAEDLEGKDLVMPGAPSAITMVMPSAPTGKPKDSLKEKIKNSKIMDVAETIVNNVKQLIRTVGYDDLILSITDTRRAILISNISSLI